MLDIPSLERRWLKYKVKHFLPHILISVLSIISIILISIFLSSNDKKSLISSSIVEQTKSAQTLTKNIELKSTDMILEPSMQFIESISPNTNQSIQPQSNTALNAKKVNIQQKIITIPTTATTQNTIMPPPTLINQTTASIKRDSAPLDIHEIEERFKSNSNPHLGLYIARYHYDHGNYNESYNYALKTNAINSTLEGSWIVFVKSLVKLGKVDQAKKTLQLYISQTNSESAKSLLDSLNKEGIK